MQNFDLAITAGLVKDTAVGTVGIVETARDVSNPAWHFTAVWNWELSMGGAAWTGNTENGIEGNNNILDVETSQCSMFRLVVLPAFACLCICLFSIFIIKL